MSTYSIARWHTLSGLTFAVVALVVGIRMAITHDYAQQPVHSHAALLGLVLSILYGSVYRLWIRDSGSRLPIVQLVLHQAGTIVLVAGLYLVHASALPEASLAPVLGMASLSILLAAVLMLWLVARAPGSARATGLEDLREAA